MKTESLIGIISLISGIISLGLTIYFTNNLPLQIGFAVTLVISAMVFFGYFTYGKTEQLEAKYIQLQQEMTKFKERIDIYSRLANIENKIERGK